MYGWHLHIICISLINISSQKVKYKHYFTRILWYLSKIYTIYCNKQALVQFVVWLTHYCWLYVLTTIVISFRSNWWESSDIIPKIIVYWGLKFKSHQQYIKINIYNISFKDINKGDIPQIYKLWIVQTTYKIDIDNISFIDINEGKISTEV